MTNTSMTRTQPNSGRSYAPSMLFPFDRFFRGAFGDDDSLSSFNWSPPVDIRETEEAYMVSIELPGMSKDEVEITHENNVLSVSGERGYSDEQSGTSFHRRERAYGKFHRSFALPKRVHGDRIEAQFTNGVLDITVPKVEEARPRKIEIR